MKFTDRLPNVPKLMKILQEVGSMLHPTRLTSARSWKHDSEKVEQDKVSPAPLRVLTTSANLGILCMPHPSMRPLV